jgi:cation-transporting ATPase E
MRSLWTEQPNWTNRSPPGRQNRCRGNRETACCQVLGWLPAGSGQGFTFAGSELMSGINKVLRWLSWLMVIVAPALFLRELQSQPWRIAVRLAVAGLVGMIPEGLVLLTTLAFLSAALRLGRRQVLVQELPAVETLARIDALCVDKTGTLTEGRTRFSQLVTDDPAEGDVRSALAGLASARGANATLTAIGEGIEPPGQPWAKRAEVPFNSARKWSAAEFEGHGIWVLGAPEVILAADPSAIGPRAEKLAAAGSRVLVLARGQSELHGEDLPQDLSLVALVELAEHARPEVTSTLDYFARQGVTVRVISGDSPLTVRSVAVKVGVPDADRAVDARSLPDPEDPAFARAVEVNRVFGRVTPAQKRRMVDVLQSNGHTVAMTGDGVNDVLALKEADLGVAMGSGSAITRGVAQIVMLDDNFDRLPSVVAEGRRVLANIETAACLFLVKNVYSLVLSVAISITGWPYPLLPRHLTLISAVGIGIPGFFLALGPNDRRFVPGFLGRVLAFSAMAGAVTAAAVMLTYGVARGEGLTGDQSRTAAITVTVVVTLWVLWIVSRPMTRWRAVLLAAMAGLFLVAYLTPVVAGFFSLQHRPGTEVSIEAVSFGLIASAVIEVLSRWGPVKKSRSALLGSRPAS